MKDNISVGLIGISHKTAPVEIREEVAFSVEEQTELIRAFKNYPEIEGCFILSTCNRTEIYISTDCSEGVFDLVRQRLDAFKNCSHFSSAQTTYELNGIEAVKHFFMVISSLDSQIVGEPQITGQVRDGYELAHGLEATDSVINKLFNFGMQARKKICNDTFLFDGTVSLSFAGVELARKIFSDLAGKEILLIGAGKTAELAAYHFMEDGVNKINVVNRTLEKAVELADKFKGKAYGLNDLKTALANADIVISATSSKEYILTYDVLNPICKLRYHQPIFLIDLAIPRDIDPKIETMENVFLYNLDDLEEIVKVNLEQREKEIPRAMKIVEEFTGEFQNWMSAYSMNAVIGKLKEHLDILRRNEIHRFKKQLPENGYSQEINNLTESIINKVIRQHVKSLKRNASDPDVYQQQVDLIMNMFGIDKD